MPATARALSPDTLTLDTLDLERHGRVLVARYRRPPLNFLDAQGATDLHRLVVAADRAPDVGAVVITGGVEGRFITHFDVAELDAAARFPAPPLTPTTGAAVVLAGLLATRLPGARRVGERLGGGLGVALATLGRLHSVIHRMHRSGTTFIAAVNGPCLGAGLEVALACDLRIAEDVPGVRFGQPEVLGGIIPGAGGTQHLPRVVGTAKALELIVDGATVDSAEALDLGLLSAVSAKGALLDDALAVATRWASRPAPAVAAAKRAVYRGASLPFAAGLVIEAGGLVAAGKSRESRLLARRYADDLARLGDSPFVADEDTWVSGGHGPYPAPPSSRRPLGGGSV